MGSLKRIGRPIEDFRYNPASPTRQAPFGFQGEKYKDIKYYYNIYDGLKEKRLNIEDGLQPPGGDIPVFSILGWCYICGESLPLRCDGLYHYPHPITGAPRVNWRESLVCPRCGLNGRFRGILHMLQSRYDLTPNDRIYLTEQQTPFYHLLKTKFFSTLIGSEFLGIACPLGHELDGTRNEDLTRLSFSDRSLDAVLCFDVLEHVPQYRKAFSEVHRVLAPGGLFLFTVPLDPGLEQTRVRAQILENGTISHLLPPEYHGDPLSADGCLVFNDFGLDVLDQLENQGFIDTHVLDYWSREYGYLGNCQMIAGYAPK